MLVWCVSGFGLFFGCWVLVVVCLVASYLFWVLVGNMMGCWFLGIVGVGDFVLWFDLLSFAC